MTAVSSAKASYKWTAMFIICLGTFIGGMDLTTVNIALPRLSEVFGAEPRVVIWIQIAYLLVGTGLMLALGGLGDLIGRKRVYVLGLVVFSLGLGLSALAPNLEFLILARVVQAVGQAMEVSTSTAIITAAFPSQERGKAIGIISSVVAAGLGVGPIVGGILLDVLDWRAIFYLRLPLVLGAAIMARWLLREERAQTRRPTFDLAGAATVFVGLGSILVWVNQGPRWGWTSPPSLLLAILGLASMTAFLAVEKRAVRPVLDLGLFRDRLFTAATASMVLYFVALPFFSLLLPFYLIQGAGFSSAKAGLYLAIFPISRAALAAPSGWLSDRIGSRLLCSLGMVVVAIGLFAVGRLGASPSTWGLVLSMGALALGSAAFGSPNTSAIMGSVPPDRLGTASGMVATGRQVGQSLGMAVAGSVFAYRQGVWLERLPPTGGQALAMVHSYADALSVATVVALLGAATSLVRGGHQQGEKR